jgi:hypothetical protein
MGLDKAIMYGKEKRKPYYGSKAFDCTCRNHGSCSYCLSNRLYQYNKAKLSSDQRLDDYKLNN